MILDPDVLPLEPTECLPSNSGVFASFYSVTFLTMTVCPTLGGQSSWWNASHAEAVLIRVLGLINYKKIFMVYKLQLEQVSGSSGIRTHDGTEKMIFCTTTAIAGCW